MPPESRLKGLRHRGFSSNYYIIVVGVATILSLDIFEQSLQVSEDSGQQESKLDRTSSTAPDSPLDYSACLSE